MSVIGLEGDQETPINSSHLQKALEVLRLQIPSVPGTGPTLHAHRGAFETFTVLRADLKFIGTMMAKLELI